MTHSNPSMKASGACDFCGSQIPLLDLEEKRAGVVSGRMCCAACLDSGAWVGAAKKPAGDEARVCRAQARFVPTLHLDLTLRLPGWRGRLFGNLTRQWLDVSGAGLRAVVARRCAVGDLLMAAILHRPTGKLYEIISTVRNVQESRKFRGSVVAGFEFVNASQEFRDVIRKTYDPTGIVDSHAAKLPAKDTKRIG